MRLNEKGGGVGVEEGLQVSAPFKCFVWKKKLYGKILNIYIFSQRGSDTLPNCRVSSI